jgi:hypothetical protein
LNDNIKHKLNNIRAIESAFIHRIMAQHTPPVSTKRSNHSGGGGLGVDHLDEIDLDSLRLVFGSASPEDLNNRKAHELRALWLQKTATQDVASPLSETANDNNTNNTAARMPRFLLDPKNKDHIPPHAVALQLLLGRKGRRDINDGDGLYQRVARHESGEHSAQNGRGLHHENNNNNQHHPSHHQRNNNNNTMMFGPLLQSSLVLVAILSLTCQFVLEVLGGAGAIWGCAELIRLRKGGPVDPSWHFFTWVAMGVGIGCLLRFFLVHPFIAGATDPTFAEKHKLFRRLSKHNRNRFGLVLELAQLVARDPVLFLHPTKGHAFSSCCGCYCVYVGNSRSFEDPERGIPNGAFDLNGGDIIPNDNAVGNVNGNAIGSSGNGNQHHLSSPPSLRKPSPQRRTWDLSDDERDNENENEVEFVNA